MKYVFVLLVCLSTTSFGQTITAAQTKSLNSYVYCASRSADDIHTVMKSLQYYYLTFYRTEYVEPRFTCPLQMLDDPFAAAVNESVNLPAAIAASLNEKLKSLQADITKIHADCQALETYHKLKDWQRDNLAKADQLIGELQSLTKSYHAKQAALAAALIQSYGKLNAVAASPYRAADDLMRQVISDEYNYIDKWTMNMNEKVHTGWPFDELKESIAHTEAFLKKLQSTAPAISPQAKDSYVSFQEGLADILKIKQHALDNYNPSARNSDKLGNDLYFELVSNLNGALISDYNNFIESASSSGYSGLHAIQYAPAFEVRNTVVKANLATKPFTDTPHIPITIAKQKTALTKSTFQALNKYVEFIYSNFNSIELISRKTENFSSTAADYKGYTSFERRRQLEYQVPDFKVPLTEYTQTIAASTALPAHISKSLNAQATILLDILKEMEQLIIVMSNETSTKNYEKDHLNKIYEILERQAELLYIWDDRKEQLYDDVRMVYEAYPPVNAADPWYKSGRALQRLADANRKALFEAKAMYKINDVSKGIATGVIDSLVRNLIENEFTNLKGVPRLGGSNGNDPFTPYEKLPQISGVLSEKFANLKPGSVRPPGFSHPYNEQVHLYNVGVNALDKFSELSKTALILWMPIQPPFFKMNYPEKEVAKDPVSEVPKAIKQQDVIQGTLSHETLNQEVSSSPKTNQDVLRMRDTIVIEKHDTIYIRETDANLRSMEGYAINNMVLLIDISGSMNTPERLPLLKQSLLSMLPMMRPEDKVSIVVYAEKPKVMLQPTSFRDENKVKKVLSRLIPSGKTNGNAGLKMAYELADENYLRGGNNRIILATDGEFPVTEELQKYISDFTKQDIFLTVFNFGAEGETRLTLEQLSKLGRGNFKDITKESAEVDLIREAKSKKAN